MNGISLHRPWSKHLRVPSLHESGAPVQRQYVA